MSERWPRIAALVSLVPILFGIAFVIYAFTTGAVTKIIITGETGVSVDETIVEAGGDAGIVFAFAPLVIGIFVAILLHLGRKDNDLAPVYMAWAFSAFVAVASVVGTTELTVYFIVPALLMLLATGVTHYVVASSQSSALGR